MHPPQLEDMTTLDALRAAWARVQQGGGAAGTDGLTVADFACVVHEELPRLHQALQGGTYRPQPLRYAALRKSAGTLRELAYPTVRDRVVQTAVYQQLGPWLDRTFLDVSFGYRPGRSYLDAVRAVTDAREVGFDFVLDADIETFFDTVPHALLLRRLRDYGLERTLVRLLRAWIKAPVCKNGRLVRRRRMGLPQGAVVSPLLANCYLDALDRRMQEEPGRLVRYADDFVVLCRTRRAARQAHEIAREVLSDLRLRLHAEKTRVASFAEGFFFLGYRFQERTAVPQKQAEQRGYGRLVERPGTASHSRAVAAAQPATSRVAVGASSAPSAPVLPNWEVSISTPFSARSAGPARVSSVVASGDGATRDGTALAIGGNGTTLRQSAAVPAERKTSSPPPAAPVPKPPRAKPNPAPSSSSAAPRALYLQRQGSTLRLRQGRFVLTAPGDESDAVLDVPARKVSHVVVLGACHLTLAVKRHCLRTGIPVTYLAQSGAFYGQLVGAPPADTNLLRCQLQRTCEADTRLRVARALVDAKLANSHALLRRHAGDDAVDAARRRLRRTRRSLPQAGTLDALRGHEGAGAAAFFGVFGRLLKAPGFTFGRRARRPPTDPVNALLSLGYTLLFHHVKAFLHVCGLHAHAGFLHEARPDHPALASDLVEPFRVLVERLALRLVNRRVLQPGDFQTRGAGGDGAAERACLLVPDARKRFFRSFEALLDQQAPCSGEERPVTYRRRLHRAAQNMAAFVQGESEMKPFRLR